MISDKQFKEINEHLEKAQNPIFYYDNDADGLCSFVLIRKFINRGKGIAIRSFPDLNASYAKKAYELNADCVFVLDKPIISEEFIEEIDKISLPIIWIDHHETKIQEKIQKNKNIFIYNPLMNKEKSNEPVTYICYKLTKRKEDMWLALIGCVSDHFIPEFADEFSKNFPEFWGKIKTPSEALFKTEIGKLAMALNFGLKDSTTNIVKLQNFLISCRNPTDVLANTSENYNFRKKYYEMKKKYEELIEKAKKNVQKEIIFFVYSGKTSISSEIANGLFFLYPDKYVVVAYENGSIVNLSLRGKNVRNILTGVLKEVGGSGGGHEDAVGARISAENLEKFKELFEHKIKSNRD